MVVPWKVAMLFIDHRLCHPDPERSEGEGTEAPVASLRSA
jgi:hypothetical protein